METSPSQPADYNRFQGGLFAPAATNPISTFPLNLDTRSYEDVRRYINSGSRPPKEAVRIEEMINHFTYTYEQPKGDQLFSISLEAARCPWQPEHRLVRVGLKARDFAAGNGTIAKEAEVAVEFDTANVASYRLIGYENPASDRETNRGIINRTEEIHPGQSVTALYELIPTKGATEKLLTVRLRYRRHDTDAPQSIELSLVDSGTEFTKASSDFRFAAAVARFGMILRGSDLSGNHAIAAVIDWAQQSRDQDQTGSRAEFVELARKAQRLPL